MCEDARHVAGALDAQWQNTVGDVISAEALLASVDARAQAFNELLNTLGLPAGALMTKRLLAQ
jgi:ABC-type transporter Mla subunit MlaD